MWLSLNSWFIILKFINESIFLYSWAFPVILVLFSFTYTYIQAGRYTFKLRRLFNSRVQPPSIWTILRTIILNVDVYNYTVSVSLEYSKYLIRSKHNYNFYCNILISNTAYFSVYQINVAMEMHTVNIWIWIKLEHRNPKTQNKKIVASTKKRNLFIFRNK